MTEPHKPLLRFEGDELYIDANKSVPGAFDAGVAHGVAIVREEMGHKQFCLMAQRNAIVGVTVGALVVSNWSSIKIISSSLKKKCDNRREAKRKETK